MAHISVLLQETIDSLGLKPGMTVVDGTFGGGGHSMAIAGQIGLKGILIALDRDESVFGDQVVSELKKKCQFHFAVENFRYCDQALDRLGIGEIDAAVFDLGLSSMQLDDSGRGFSFLRNEPLAMTFAVSDSLLNAEVAVNEWEEESLATILLGFGEETFAKRIASQIIEVRKIKRIKTTSELVEIIKSATPLWYHRKRIHPATKTFQALRMAVNGELNAIEEGIPKAISRLRKGGRISIISFHSIEDRLVKNIIKSFQKESVIKIVNKKPIVPSEKEIIKNPRSRSSKLRIIEKI